MLVLLFNAKTKFKKTAIIAAPVHALPGVLTAVRLVYSASAGAWGPWVRNDLLGDSFYQPNESSLSGGLPNKLDGK